jgi:hypothetical protein
MLAKAFLATLVLGTSTVAAAQPGSWTYRDRYDHGQHERYGRFENRDWIPVAQNISFYSRSMKRAPGQQSVHIGAERGNIGALMFEGTSGRTVISQVFVRYTDGSSETINVNRVLMPGETAIVRLGRYAAVKAIGLFTQPDYYGRARDEGTFSVLAS